MSKPYRFRTDPTILIFYVAVFMAFLISHWL
jgi:hypothetical protein